MGQHRSNRSGAVMATNESGVAALEFALVTPLLLALLVGTLTLAQAFILRFQLSTAAYDAARTCALARTPNGACAEPIVQRKLGASQRWCSALNVQATDGAEAGFPAVNAFEVIVSCNFAGWAAQVLLGPNGIVVAQLQGRAAMPR